MKLEEQRREREPDILFVGKERKHLFKKTYLDGAADLAVEIISPESIGRDRGKNSSNMKPPESRILDN